jgi:hypothetical protein
LNLLYWNHQLAAGEGNIKQIGITSIHANNTRVDFLPADDYEDKKLKTLKDRFKHSPTMQNKVEEMKASKKKVPIEFYCRKRETYIELLKEKNIIPT